jgi:hypothetical protein
MKTDHLISAMVQDGDVRSSVPVRMTGALALGGFVAIVLFEAVLGVRGDIGSALLTWRFAVKVMITLLVLIGAIWAAARLASPDASNRTILIALGVPIAMLAVAVGFELLSSPADSWIERAVGSNSRLCLASIVLMSIAPLGALLVALRVGAPASPMTAGAAAGLAAGGLGAALYAIHCIDDSPLFVVLWYIPAIIVVVLTGAVAGSRVLRW